MNNPESPSLLTHNPNVSLFNSNENYDLNVYSSSINNQLVFVDSSVEDYQVLIDNFVEQTEVIILDSQQDGIVKITETLSQYDNLDAVHIVSHGSSGELFLGNTVLSQDTLSKYQDELGDWGDSIENGGDILLYGCNVAADLTGAKFVEELSEYTQADIQASDDLTGSDELGGDWYLEYATGSVEATPILDKQVLPAYDRTLNNILIVDDLPTPVNGSYFNQDIFEQYYTIDGFSASEGPRFGVYRLNFYKYLFSDFSPAQPNLVEFDNTIFSSGFNLGYTPFDLKIVNSPNNSELSSVDFGQAENQPFILNFGEPFNPAAFDEVTIWCDKFNAFLAEAKY